VLAAEVAKPMGLPIGDCSVRVHVMPADPHMVHHGLCLHLDIYHYPSVES